MWKQSRFVCVCVCVRERERERERERDGRTDGRARARVFFLMFISERNSVALRFSRCVWMLFPGWLVYHYGL